MNANQYDTFIKLIRGIQNKNERMIDELYLNELEELRILIAKFYEDHGKDGGFELQRLENLGYLQHLDKQIEERIKVLSQSQETITQQAIVDTFSESYYYRGFAIETVTAMGIYTLLQSQVVNSFIYNNLLPTKWNESINDDNNVLIKQLKTTLRTAIIQGDDFKATIGTVKERVNVAKGKALLIVQEETHRASEDANLKAMQDAQEKGVIMQKKWLSTLDSRTRKTHQHLDGQTIDIDDYFISKSGRKALAPKKFGDPKEDIQCRCTTVATFKGLEPEARRARDAQNKGEIIKYTNFNEWKQNLK